MPLNPGSTLSNADLNQFARDLSTWARAQYHEKPLNKQAGETVSDLNTDHLNGLPVANRDTADGGDDT